MFSFMGVFFAEAIAPFQIVLYAGKQVEWTCLHFRKSKLDGIALFR